MQQATKRLGAIALSLALLTVCAGCDKQSSSGAGSTTNAAQTTVSTAASGTTAGGKVQFTYTSGSTKIAIAAESDPIVAALGTPTKTFEAPSCAFEGISYTYSYNGFQLETYPDKGVNRVYAVTLTDATVQTAEGVKVGDTLAAVKTACGEPDVASAAFVVYTGEGVALQFFLTDEKVSSIVYTYR